jgi:hypothetical protein
VRPHKPWTLKVWETKPSQKTQKEKVVHYNKIK